MSLIFVACLSDASTAARLFLLALFPAVVLAQASNSTSGTGTPISSASGGGNSRPTTFTSTFLTTLVFSSGTGQPSTLVSPVVTTITSGPQQSGNNTNSSNNTTSSSTRPLSTGPQDVTLGGGGPSGAPVPGQSGAGGIYGPDDSYTSSVVGLTGNVFLGSLVALVAGGLLVLR